MIMLLRPQPPPQKHAAAGARCRGDPFCPVFRMVRGALRRGDLFFLRPFPTLVKGSAICNRRQILRRILAECYNYVTN